MKSRITRHKVLVRVVMGLAVLAVAVSLALYGYVLVTPAIIIVNRSYQLIEEVIIQLPSNRVVFSHILPNGNVAIHYSWNQGEGPYEYQVRMSDQTIRAGKCGYVTNREIGKRLTLTVEQILAVICEESNTV